MKDAVTEKAGEALDFTKEFFSALGGLVKEKAEDLAKISSKKLKAASEITAELAKKAAEKTKDYSLLLRPLEKNEKFSLTRLEPYLNQEEYTTVASWLKQNKADVSIVRYGWSFLISGKDHLPKIISKEKYTDALNEKIQKVFFQWRFQ